MILQIERNSEYEKIINEKILLENENICDSDDVTSDENIYGLDFNYDEINI